MQIQITPPKQQNPYQTPPKVPKAPSNEMSFQTPPKHKFKNITSTTPKKGQNPQSKRLNNSCYRASNFTSLKKITPFNVTRLEQDYQFIRHLGYGNFSRVGLYRSLCNNENYAIKITNISSMSINQIQALSTLNIYAQRSNNIVRYFHSWIEDGQALIVMEYCDGSLASLIQAHRRLGQQIQQAKIKDYMKQILQGLKVIHENKMVHLDIKPQNLMLKGDCVKITDLGFCRVTQIKRLAQLEEGDSRYLAMEVLNYHEGIDLTKADIFSLGISIFEALTLNQLETNGETWRQIRKNGLRLKETIQISQYSNQLLQIVEDMTLPHWADRPSAADLLQRKYIKGQFPRRVKALKMNGKHKLKRDPSL